MFGDCVYGLVFVGVLVPQGNPLGKGLLVKKSGSKTACKVPKSDFPLVADCDRAAVTPKIQLRAPPMTLLTTPLIVPKMLPSKLIVSYKSSLNKCVGVGVSQE